MKRQLVVLGLSAVLLSACGAPSVSDLKNDPKLMRKVAQQCMDMKPAEARDDQACQNLKTAAQELAKEQMEKAQKAINQMLGH